MLAGFVALALLPSPTQVIAAPDDRSLVTALERIETDALPLCDDVGGAPPLGAAIDALLADDEAGAASVRTAVSPIEAVNDLIYRRLGIRASRDAHDPCNLLPSAVLARRQGYCVGIAAIYLALAERLDLPIHAVAIPSHVYLRWDDQRARIDIETLAMGGPFPEGLDDLKAHVTATAPESTTADSPAAKNALKFPRDLDTNGFLAQVHNNLGAFHSKRSDHARAAVEYRRALDLDPMLSAAWYNWGYDLFLAGEHRDAIRKFDEALRLAPADIWALNNRGRSWAELGKKSRARRDFEAALAIDPTFRPARRNLKDLDHEGSPAP